MVGESGEEIVPALFDPVVIGIVGSPHGVQGTLRVRATGSGAHLREGVEPVVGGVRRRILRTRETPKGFLVDLEGIGGRPKAKTLRGQEMFLDRGDLDAPDEDEVYVSDLVGLDAMNETGESLGIVAGSFETPAHEVLVIRDDNETESTEFYVPFTLEHVPEMDLEARRVVVRLPEE